MRPRQDVDALDDDLGEDDEWEPPAPEVLVRVLGPPRVDGHPNLGRLDVSLVAFLACNGGQATEDQVVNAVWGGRAIEKVTLWNRISKARVSLGAALPAREQGASTVRLADGVLTDLSVMKAFAARAEEVSSGEAIDLLLRATALIEGTPFDAQGYDWSYEHQFNAEACEAIESVCVRLAELALEHGDLSAARSAIGRGLRALPLNEPLYRWRMRAEAQAGNSEAFGPRSRNSALASQIWTQRRRRAHRPRHCTTGFSPSPRCCVQPDVAERANRRNHGAGDVSHRLRWSWHSGRSDGDLPCSIGSRPTEVPGGSSTFYR